MKKICKIPGIILIVIGLMGIIIFAYNTGKNTGKNMGEKNVLENIEIDGVNEVENGIITIKYGEKYLDYKYEYNEVKRIVGIEYNGKKLTNGLIKVENIDGKIIEYYFEAE